MAALNRPEVWIPLTAVLVGFSMAAGVPAAARLPGAIY
jgi:hypothetical protein